MRVYPWRFVCTSVLLVAFFSLQFGTGSVAGRNEELADSPIPIESAVNNRRYRYRELAETEFHRSGYFPVPFVVGGTGPRLSRISTNDLSELVRNHIAYIRQQHQIVPLNNNGIGGQGTPILQGVRGVTELRQTPYRRFPTNSSKLSYEEKRRRWKAELRRRLKQPPRPLAAGPLPSPHPTIVISHPAATRPRDEDRYYVTYSPYNHIYQVSRKPPPHLYTTETDEMPPSIADVQSAASTVSVPESSAFDDNQGEMTERRRGPMDEERVETRFSQTPAPTPKEFEEEYEEEEPSAAILPTEPIVVRTTAILPTTTTPMPTTTTTTTTTTTPPPALFIVQAAYPIATNRTTNLQVRVAAVKPSVKLPIVKQILHLDDYDQDIMDDDDGDVAEEENSVPTTVESQRQAPPTDPAYQRSVVSPPVRTTPLPPAGLVYPTKATQPPRSTLHQSTYKPPQVWPTQPLLAPTTKKTYSQPEWDDLGDEEDDDEDFFWSKPGQPAAAQPHPDPFQITSHQSSVARRKLRD